MFDVIKYEKIRDVMGGGAYVQVENWPHLQSSSQVISHASAVQGTNLSFVFRKHLVP